MVEWEIAIIGLVAGFVGPLALELLRWYRSRRGDENKADSVVVADALAIAKERRESEEALRERIRHLETEMITMRALVEVYRQYKAGSYVLYYQALANGLTPQFNPDNVSDVD